MMFRLRHVVFSSHVSGDDFSSAASLMEAVLKLQAERDQATSPVRDNPESRPVLPSCALAISEGRY